MAKCTPVFLQGEKEQRRLLKKYHVRGLAKPKISWQRKCLYSTMLALREREGRSM